MERANAPVALWQAEMERIWRPTRGIFVRIAARFEIGPRFWDDGGLGGGIWEISVE